MNGRLVVQIDPKHPAFVPVQATSGSAGFDVKSAESVTIPPGGMVLVPAGFKMAFPAGWVAKLFVRSSLPLKRGLILANSVGAIDSDYRGEVKVALRNIGHQPATVKQGERIAQLVFQRYETPVFSVVHGLDDTERGSGGFGSTS